MNNNYLEIISLINSKMALNVKPKGNYKKMAYNPQGLYTQPVLYSQILITRKIPISINNIGNSIKETLGKAIAFQIEGKCIVEGYIKPNTIEIITFSSGLVSGSNVIFEVVFQCYVCSPVEGMLINCVAKHINKAGIRAEVKETPSPVVIFIARDHNYASPLFAQVKENDDIKIRVIGQRFELNDKYISIIAELVEMQQMQTQQGQPLRRTIKKKITIAPAAEPEAAEAVEAVEAAPETAVAAEPVGVKGLAERAAEPLPLVSKKPKKLKIISSKLK